jgi:hypothetical protein
MFRSCALHEAGHAVVAERLGLRVHRLDYFNINDGAVDVEDSDDHEKLAMVALAGLAASELFEGPVDPLTEDQSSDDCDLPTARRHVVALVGPGGDVDGALGTLRQRTDELLSLPGTEQVVRSIADEAVRYRGLDGDAVRRLIAEGPT